MIRCIKLIEISHIRADKLQLTLIEGERMVEEIPNEAICNSI